MVPCFVKMGLVAIEDHYSCKGAYEYLARGLGEFTDQYCPKTFGVMPLNHYGAMCQAMHGAPLYIAETSPPQIRGTLISLKELFIALGILVVI